MGGLGTTADGNGPPATEGLTPRLMAVCGLLLMASAINYMDRQTIASIATRITREFELTQEQYGNLEGGFGWAFAAGSILFGFMADRVAIRWLYPCVLVIWSAVGFATGFAKTYDDLLICRILLGFFEAGHWPCGIRTVRGLVAARGRAMGNGILQSGTSIGAITTPLIMRWMLTEEAGSWRIAFQVIGAVGLVWAIAWFLLVRPDDIRIPSKSKNANDAPWWIALCQRRMWVVLVVIALINTAWQMLRAWLTKFLQEGRGYSEDTALLFNSSWFVATDIGCLTVGAIVLLLVHRGLRLQSARVITFCGCALMCMGTVLIPWLPKGPLLLVVLWVVGAGALGLFPLYYAFTQDISARHQGKVTGLTGVAAWIFTPLAQNQFGRLVDRTGSFDAGMAAIGFLPLLAGIVLWLFWGDEESNEVDHAGTT